MRERRKRRVVVLVPVCIWFISLMAVSVFWLREYRQAAFEHISKFCEIILENNPEAETQILSAVKEYHTLTEQEMEGSTFLAQYGYRPNEFCKELGWDFLVFSAVLLFTTAGCFLFSVRYVDRRNRMRITELTNYLERVNSGADGTIIQMKEDEFSPLQDELYKTVTELYQTRDSAVKAKVNFAGNLTNIAHQLKTPITAASLSLQLMEETAPNIYAEQVKRQLERLSRLEEYPDAAFAG